MLTESRKRILQRVYEMYIERPGVPLFFSQHIMDALGVKEDEYAIDVRYLVDEGLLRVPSKVSTGRPWPLGVNITHKGIKLVESQSAGQETTEKELALPMWDFFIVHASEDKNAVARHLANALSERGVSVWYDEFTLTLGDSLHRSIERGLAESRYGIVILSPNFFAKEWPQRELDGLVAKEVTSGEKAILPVWHNVTQEYVARFSPTLADRIAVSTKRGMDTVVAEILRAARPGVGPVTRPARPIKDIQVGTSQLAKLRDLHRQNISGTNVPNKPSRLTIVIGPKDAHLAIRMTEGLDDTFRTLVKSKFSNISGRERRNSNHIRLYLTLRFKAPYLAPVLTPIEERDPSLISFDRDATLLFTDYIQRVQYPGHTSPVLVRSLEHMAQDMYRIFTIAEHLYREVAKYGGRLYVGLSLTNLWGTALQDLIPPPQQAQIVTWHTEVELSADSTKGNAIFHALSSLLRDLQYSQSEQPVKEILEKLGIE